jgi:hypothetical protein
MDFGESGVSPDEAKKLVDYLNNPDNAIPIIETNQDSTTIIADADSIPEVVITPELTDSTTVDIIPADLDTASITIIDEKILEDELKLD